MSNFIVYNKTGEILRTGTCPESMLKIQASDNDESVIEGRADDVCDQVNTKTKKVMKNHKTTPEKLAQKLADEEPEREKESLIQRKMNQITRKMAVDELIKEGKIIDQKEKIT